jgi:hypothetical protein
MRTTTLIAVTLIVVGCARAPGRVYVDLIAAPVTLSPESQTFRLSKAAPTDNDSVGVCVTPPKGYELRDDWSLGPSEALAVRLSAEVTLTNGRVVLLPEPSWSGDYCLHPEGDGPLEAPVQEVRVASTGPLTVENVTWVSTAK